MREHDLRHGHLTSYPEILATATENLQADAGLLLEQVVNACPFRRARGGGRFVCDERRRTKDQGRRLSSCVPCGANRAKLLADQTGYHREERQERLAGELRRVRGQCQRGILLGAVRRIPLLLRADPRHLRLLRSLPRTSARDRRVCPIERPVKSRHAGANPCTRAVAHFRQRR